MKILRNLALPPSTLKNLLTLFAVGLLFWTSITLPLPILPTYIQDLGATTLQISIVMGCFAAGLLLSRTKLGRLADYRGRKIVLLLGSFVAATAPLGYLAVDSLPNLMVIRAFHGTSVAAFTTGYSTLAIDFSPPKQKGQIIGYMSLALPIGMALGPALGGYIAEWAGYTTLFMGAGIVGTIALILAWQLKEAHQLNTHKSASQTNSRKNVSSRSLRELINTRSLRIPAVMMMQIGMAFGTIITFLPLYIKDIGIDFNVGLFYTAAAIASFSVRLFAGKASDIYGRGIFITTSLFFYLGSMLLLYSAHTPTAFLMAAVLEGTGAGILIPTTVAMVSDRSTPDEQGQVYSFCIGGFDLGFALTGLVFGVLSTALDYRSIYLISAAVVLQAIILFTSLSSKDIAHSLRFAVGGERDIYVLK